MQEAHDPYGALRQRNYRRLLSGSILFTLGTEMQAVAVGIELFQRTGSEAAAAAALGFAGLVQFLPVLLLALPAGHVADRFDCQKVLITAQALAAITSLGLTALSFWHGPVPVMFLCLLMVGVGRAFNVPARWALLPRVISTELLPNAVTWNSTGFFIARAAGPPLGGLVVALTVPVAGYLLSAFCVLCCIGLISTIRPEQTPATKEAPSFKSLLAGLHFVWETKPILATISLDLFAVLLGGATALFPIYAEEILRVGPWGLGLLRAAPALGALVMAVFMAYHPPLHHAGKTLLAAVSGFGVATILFGLSVSFPLSLAALFLTGALDNISVVIRGTLIQTLTPEAMRGRVGAVHFVFVSSSNELGEFESGVTAYYFGAVASVVMGGIGTVLVVLAVMALWPGILRLSLARPTQQERESLSEVEEMAPPA
jgi:MFS family permease